MWLWEPDSLVNIAHLSQFMFGGPWSGRPPVATAPARRWEAAATAGYNPRGAQQSVTWPTVDATSCWPSDDVAAFEKIHFALRWGTRFSIDRSDADQDWQEAGTG
jgi:hypothetical protein